jgi:hypothetical protein
MTSAFSGSLRALFGICVSASTAIFIESRLN